MKSNINKWIKISALLMFFFVTLLFSHQAQASVKENVFGSAWSENTGWISFNSCPNPFVSTGCSFDYGVKVDKTSLVVSGVAWSDNLGWISFNPGDWGACPPGVSKPCTNFKNTWGSGGWARVVSAKAYDTDTDQNKTNSGGFDGWISLGGSGFSAPFDTTKNVASSMPSAYQGKYVYTINSSSSGYWLGSEVMGWIDLKPKSSYDPNEGGVFLMDISNDTLTLTPTPSSGNVLAGDTIDIHWDVKGFTPTTCSGTMYDISNNPITGRADWVKTFNTSSATSGDITGIEVPYDPSNASSLVTKFTLSCSDSVKTVDNTITITAEPLTVFMRDYFGGSCVSGSASTFDWSTNDTTPSCQIDAVPAPGGSSAYTVPVSGTPPIYDTDFKKNYGNGATKYSFSCQNGSGKYQSPVKATTTGTVSIKQCVADYTMSYNPSCQPFAISSVPGYYDATVELAITPSFGFNNTIDVSDGGGLGKWAFSSSKFSFLNPDYSKVNATLSLTDAEYKSIDWKKPFTRDVLLDTSGFYQRSQPIKLCELGGKSTVKPKYKPF